MRGDELDRRIRVALPGIKKANRKQAAELVAMISNEELRQSLGTVNEGGDPAQRPVDGSPRER